MGKLDCSVGMGSWIQRRRHIAVVVAFAGSCALSAAPIWAHDPEVPFYQWLVSRQRPDFPGPCCGAGPHSDQYYSDRYERNADGSYTVFIDGFAEPAHAPANKVIPDDVNPTGRGVIWMSTSWVSGISSPDTVYCFEPGMGT